MRASKRFFFSVLTFFIAANTGCLRRELTRFRKNREISFKIINATGGHGTGVVVSKNGFILTAAHVASDDTLPLAVVVRDEDGKSTQIPAEVIAVNPVNDLALLKIQRSFKHAASIHTGKLQEGDEIYCVGYPYAYDKVTGRGYIMKLNFSEPEKDIFNQTLVDISDGSGTSGAGIFDAQSGGLVSIMSGTLMITYKDGISFTARITSPRQAIRELLNQNGVIYELTE